MKLGAVKVLSICLVLFCSRGVGYGHEPGSSDSASALAAKMADAELGGRSYAAYVGTHYARNGGWAYKLVADYRLAAHGGAVDLVLDVRHKLIDGGGVLGPEDGEGYAFAGRLTVGMVDHASKNGKVEYLMTGFGSRPLAGGHPSEYQTTEFVKRLPAAGWLPWSKAGTTVVCTRYHFLAGGNEVEASTVNFFAGAVTLSMRLLNGVTLKALSFTKGD